MIVQKRGATINSSSSRVGIQCIPGHSTHSPITDYLRGEDVCKNCGVIIKEGQDFGDEGVRALMKTGRGDTDRSRTGPPETLAVHDKGLYTVVGLKKVDADGVRVPNPVMNEIKRISFWDRRSQVKTNTNRNLLQAFSELQKITDKLNISDQVKERAAYIYRKALDKNLIRGRGINNMIKASLYAACRQSETPRDQKQFTDACGISKHDLVTNYKIIVNELDLTIPVKKKYDNVYRAAANAGVSEKSARLALKLISDSEEKLDGLHPDGVAAAALFIACIMNSEYKTQMEIANAAGVSAVTIRNRFKSIERALNYDLEVDPRRHGRRPRSHTKEATPPRLPTDKSPGHKKSSLSSQQA